MGVAATALLGRLVGPTLVEPVPIDLATIPVRDAERSNGRLVATPLTFVPVGAVQPVGYRDTDPVANNATSERATAIPSGMDVRGVNRLIGVLVVTRLRPTVGANGTAFPGFTEVVVAGP